jgi:hypothetical protein
MKTYFDSFIIVYPLTDTKHGNCDQKRKLQSLLTV